VVNIGDWVRIDSRGLRFVLGRVESFHPTDRRYINIRWFNQQRILFTNTFYTVDAIPISPTEEEIALWIEIELSQ
jgi:hypothetical protein